MKKSFMQQETLSSGARAVGLKPPAYIRPSLLTAQCNRFVSENCLFYMVSHNCTLPFLGLKTNMRDFCHHISFNFKYVNVNIFKMVFFRHCKNS